MVTEIKYIARGVKDQPILIAPAFTLHEGATIDIASETWDGDPITYLSLIHI